jgi:hypothetical protein
MNFLAHFLLARHIDSADFHLGAILPDISRRAGFRIQEQHLSEVNSAYDLNAGIRLHWHADARFHNSELFHLGFHVWKEALGPLIPETSRKFFLFHLLAEMWLDRLLLLENPDAAFQFYESLASTDAVLVFEMAERLGDTNRKLSATLEDFRQRRFILDYAAPEKFASLASGVFAHVSRQEFSIDLRSMIQETLPMLSQSGSKILSLWEDFSAALQKDLGQGLKL